MGKGFSLKQPSLAGGIISPQALGRTDQNKYATGLRTCSNAVVTRYGTIENRAGTGYCGTVKTPANQVRLVPFVSFLGTSYVLEFGIATFPLYGTISYLRPWKNGALIPWGSLSAWSSLTTYPVGAVVTYSGSTWYNVQPNSTNILPSIAQAGWVNVSSSVVEIPLVAQGWDSTTAYQTGQWVAYTPFPTAYIATQANTDSTPPSAAWSALTGYGLGLIPTTSQLAAFQFVQQNDILTIAAQGMTPVQVLHFSDTNWTFQQVALSSASAPVALGATPGAPSSTIATPASFSASGGAVGAGADHYQVAAYSNSLSAFGAATPGFHVNGVVHVATGGSPITVTWSAVSGASGYIVYKQPQGSGPTGLLAVIESGTTFVDDASLTPVLPVAPQSSPSGATVFIYVVTSIDGSTGVESVASNQVTCTGGTPSTGSPNVINWQPVSGSSKYNVYSIVGGVPGYIGSTANTTFNDANFIPDTSKQPPTNSQSLLSSINDTPAVVAYYQQRLCFANTVNEPSTVWMSNVGAYTTFSVGIPPADSQFVQFALAGVQVQPITAIVDLGKMIVHTTNAEYVVTGNAFGAITPSAVSVVNTGSAGAALIQPVVIGNTDLFVQYGATRLNDLRYEVQRFTFAGKDLTKFATDLFKGRTIVATAFQKLPHSIVWCVLDNGALLGLTYVSEDELYAWHAHTTTGGFFEQVACVIEGSQWVLYAVVRRTINGSTVRYLERFASRECLDTVLFSDSVFLDASLTYDGRNSNGTLMSSSPIGGWTVNDLQTLSSSAPYFSSSDVGNEVVYWQTDQITGLITDIVVFTIVRYTDHQSVDVRPSRNVPTWAQVTALTTFGKAVKTFTGMDHLDGQAIGVLADGNVVADPLQPTTAFPTITVSGGAFTLTEPAMVVTAGLPIQTDVQTLPLENAQGESIQNKRVVVREATPILYNSRGGSYGQDSAHLNTWKQPNPATGYPIAGYTGPVRIPIQGTFQPTGSVWMRHTEPTPWSLSGVIVTVEIGD